MLASFQSFNSCLLGRTISIACVLIAFSYIFFEVLDLDGSDFRTQRDPMQMTAIIQEVETEVIRPQLGRSVNLWIEISFFLLAKPIEWVHQLTTEEFVTPTFHLLHRRGYRTALPRSSIPEDFPLSA